MRMTLSREVAVIGIGQTKFGEIWHKSFREIGIEAGLRAIQDAGIESSKVDSIYIGNMSAGLFLDQEHVASMIAEEVGLTKDSVPATRVEAADASGGLAFRQAILDISSGMSDIVVVGGAEKMSDVTSQIATYFTAAGADQSWESLFGATIPSLYALMARKHMHDFGTTREQLGLVSVKNHRNGSLNPDAQFQKEITLEQVLKAGPVSTPLGVFDCAPISDGAAAIVLAELDLARELCTNPIKVSGTGQGSDSLSIANRTELTGLKATRAASKRAYEMAGINPSEISVAEVHDSCTIGEIMAIEDLGFFEKGDGGPATERGDTSLEGIISINTSGGLKARGHPLGATGIAQINEIVLQLRGMAGKRQVKDPLYGLAQNVGGTGGTVIVHILEAI
ncbi:MAG: thiolase domain-containing protein [Candidatus Thermoplasmatota archaeon]|nr:thiolase domain-containing protein [Candidatus Thermoplasmatota archaeon]